MSEFHHRGPRAMDTVSAVIVTPSPDEVHTYLKLWEEQGNESTDSALRLLFDTMPRNVDAGEVAVKVAALNGLYATTIYGVVQMARHIVSLDIDDQLSAERADAGVVEGIAHLEQKGKVRRNYSFATKYCSFHRPDVYPIYDSLVVEVLNGLLKQGQAFDTLGPGETWYRNYDVYCRSISGLREHFGLEEFSIRDIDKYLWMVAKSVEQRPDSRHTLGEHASPTRGGHGHRSASSASSAAGGL